MRYTVMQSYRAERDGDVFGPWEAGQEIELEPVDAEWVNRDAPGTLEGGDLERVEDDASGEGPAKRQARPAPNRQHKGAGNR